MEIELLNASNMQKALEHLIRKSDAIHIATAWGYNGKVADLLIENKHKFQTVIFGLNGFSTSPDLVERLINTKNTFIAQKSGGIFHPKIYMFQVNGDIEAIIGSANFTNGGFGRNDEACLHIKGTKEEDIFEQIKQEIASYDSLKQSVTQELAETYRRQHQAAKKKRGPRDPILPNDKRGNGFTSPLAKMDWDKFAESVKPDPHHNFDGRIKLLREIQQLFASVGKFAEFTSSQRKAIAGITYGKVAGHENFEQHDWGWFGSMDRAHNFSDLVSKHKADLGAAIDVIPLKGPVTRGQFEEYCKRFSAAFKNANVTGAKGVATATRLLAMKRPDIFICVNGPNKQKLAKDMNFAHSTLSLENYWQRIIEPIQSSAWYNAPRPIGPHGELWDYRVAMLDAIYYES